MRGLRRAAALTGIATAVLVGCSTIESARKAQKSVEAKGRGEAGNAGRVVLAGASLEELVGFAMTNRPSVVTARLGVEDARLAMKAIAADAPVISDSPWTAPKLSASASHSEASKGTTFRDHNWDTEGDPSASVSLDLLIYDFGRYSAKAREQAETTVAAETALVKEGYTVFNDVAKAYFDFTEGRALLEVAFTNAAQYADHLRRAEERLSAGEANKLDVLKARLDLANARQVVAAASNRVDTTGAELMDKLGIEASRGTWETVLGEANSLGISAVRRGFGYTYYDVETAFELARTNSPAMKIARARLRAASHAVDYAIADMLPNVTASASLSWTDPLWFFRWGFGVSQTLFQGLRKTTAVERAKVALRKAESALDAEEQTLSVQIETAIANRDNSRSAMASAEASVKSAKENLDTVMEQFSVGEASRIELSDAIAAHSAAIGDVITAFYDGQRAEAKLFELTGKYPVYKEETVSEKSGS